VRYSVRAVVALLCLALVLSTMGCAAKDKTPPSTPTGIVKTTPGNDNTPAFSWDYASDAGSGVDYYLVSVDDGEWTNVGNVVTYTLSTPLSDGTHTLKVKTVDKAGNEGDEGSLSFTIDRVAPIVTNMGAGFTSSSATITWTTDEDATSQVEYGPTAAFGTSTPLDSRLVTSHGVTLTGLTPLSTYYYRVKSRDASGNETVSEDGTVGTCGSAGPSISGVSVSNVSSSGATMTWTTSVPGTSQVEYGTTTAYGLSSTEDANLVAGHSVTLSGLTGGMTYYFRVKSKDACGQESISSRYTFCTDMDALQVGQAIERGTARVTAISAVRVASVSWPGDFATIWLYPEQDWVFIIVEVRVENLGSGPLWADIGDFRLVDGLGLTYGYSWKYTADDAFVSANVYPFTGETEGKILFEVPVGATGLELTYEFTTTPCPILGRWALTFP
jgi:hypothetical protein